MFLDERVEPAAVQQQECVKCVFLLPQLDWTISAEPRDHRPVTGMPCDQLPSELSKTTVHTNNLNPTAVRRLHN